MSQLTLTEVKRTFPSTLRNSVTQDFVDKLNQMHTDPLVREAMQEKALGYLSILQEGKFKIDDYLNAVKFVTYRVSGHTQQEAYLKAFPERNKKFMLEGASAKEISAYVSMYAKGKLVTMMLERAMIPVWLVNADNFQKAINTQVELMTTANSEMVRATAANSILTHLKQPEVTKHELTVKDETQRDALTQLREATQELAKAQKMAIQSGSQTVKEVAHSEVIQAEYEEVPNDSNG